MRARVLIALLLVTLTSGLGQAEAPDQSLVPPLRPALAAPAPLDAAATEHQLQLATAVLLVEVMRADPDIGDAERAAAMTALRGKFALTDDEIVAMDWHVKGVTTPLPQ